MNYNLINKEIETYLNTQWLLLYPNDYPIVWGNIPTNVDDQDQPFLKAVVRYSEEDKENVGNVSLNRVYGILMISVYVLIDTGERLLQELTSKVKNIFRNKNINGIIFRKRNIRYIGENGRFIQQNITIEFYYDDIS